MAWDKTPWFVGGGAVHSPEVARTIAYVLTNGREGVTASTDLKVQATATPGSTVQVLTGACSILSKASGGSQQSYIGRNPTVDTVSISATGSGSGRSDLIVARVEDPFMAGEPWSAPGDPTTAQYIFTRVIPNVAAGTTTMPAGMSGIPLARIDIPANTATITNSMIKDLRRIANPKTERMIVRAAMSGGNQPSSQTGFTDFSTWNPVTVFPTWANRVIIRADMTSIAFDAGDSYGEMGLQARSGATAIPTENIVYDVNNPGSSGNLVNDTLTITGEFALDQLAGQAVNWKFVGRSLNGGLVGRILTVPSTVGILDLTFIEAVR